MNPLKPEEIEISSLVENGIVKPELISETGSYNIKNIIEYLTDPVKTMEFDKRAKRDKEKKLNAPLSINQLRKYYDSFLKIFNNGSSEDEKKVQLLMLKANTEYTAKRLKTERFKLLMASRINIVVAKKNDEFTKNMRALKLHLEALVAYYPKNL